MTEERYVDPNSGAAPQPGGFAVTPATDEEAKAAELEDPNPDPDSSRLATADAGDATQSAGEGQEDEGEYAELLGGNVEDVNEYLESHPEERDAVLDAERQGKARKGILGEE